MREAKSGQEAQHQIQLLKEEVRSNENIVREKEHLISNLNRQLEEAKHEFKKRESELNNSLRLAQHEERERQTIDAKEKAFL